MQQLAPAPADGAGRGLTAIDEERWRELTTTARRPVPPAGSPDIGPPPGVTAQRSVSFVIVPVRARFAPPCSAMVVGVILPERRGGEDVACYDVTAPDVTSDHVAGTVVVENRTTGTWSVELTLTAEGATRFQNLFREVGAGGQFAFVDGQVVSAPRFGDAAPAGKAVVSGLDEQTARNLAGQAPR